jgi:hypothetical protein
MEERMGDIEKRYKAGPRQRGGGNDEMNIEIRKHGGRERERERK